MATKALATHDYVNLKLLVLDGELTSIQNDITNIEGDISNIQNDITDISNDLTSVTHDILIINNDINYLSSAISSGTVSEQYVINSISNHNIAPTAHQDIRDAISSIAESATSAYVNNQISVHNIAVDAHTDIRNSIPSIVGLATETYVNNAVSSFCVESISNHNEASNAHTDIRNLIPSIVGLVSTEELSTAVSDHNAALDSHTDIRESIPSIVGLATETFVSSNISVHNTAVDSHTDIRNAIPSIVGLATETYVVDTISVHNESGTAHTDIRNSIPSIAGLATENYVQNNISVHNADDYAHNLLDFKKYSGFESRTDSTIDIDADGLFILAPTLTSFNVYTVEAGKHVITSPQAVSVVAEQTLSYIYIDNTGTLQIMTSPWDLTDGNNIPCATVFKDGEAYCLTDERHGYERNRAWHKWAHNNIGCMYKSGLTGTFTSTTISIAQGVVSDEDLIADTGATQTSTTLWYRNGATSMRFVKNQTVAKALTTLNVLAYDNNSGTLQPATNNRYVTNWVYATADTQQPIYTVIGQNDSATLANARNAALPTINLSTAEWKLIYRVIYQRTAGTPTGVYIEATDYRTVQTGVPTSAVATDHAALLNRDAVNSHPASAISYNDITVEDAISALSNSVIGIPDTITNAISVHNNSGTSHTDIRDSLSVLDTLSTYVPYIGANQNVDLGLNGLTTNGLSTELFRQTRYIKGTDLIESNFGLDYAPMIFQTDPLNDCGPMYFAVGNSTNYGTWQYFLKTRSTDGNTPAAVVNGDELGRILFQGDDGSSYLNAGDITMVVSEDASNNNLKADMIFNVCNGAGIDVEALRIKGVTGDIIATGNLSAANLSGTNTGDQELSGYATIDAISNHNVAVDSHQDIRSTITNLDNSLSNYANLSGYIGYTHPEKVVLMDINGNSLEVYLRNGLLVVEAPPPGPLGTPLTFTAEDAGATITLNGRLAGTYKYSVDNGTSWPTYTLGDVITLTNIGDKVMFKARTSNATCFKNNIDSKITITNGRIAASGNIQSLLESENFASKLDVPTECYYSMFKDCTFLTHAPEVPATTLHDFCYANMFRGCTSLSVAPELPATTLDTYCYVSMFHTCTSLSVAPTMPVINLTSDCLQTMFQDCINLQSINVNFSEWRDDIGATLEWMNNAGTAVSGTKTFTCPTTLPQTRGTSYIPNGWTIQTK